MPEPQTDQAARIAELAQETGRSVATAESLTSGAVAGRLGAAPEAAEWFRGGLVSYHDEVKHEVLKVDPGPVVRDKAARQMAEGVARLLSADAAVATSGAGGPDEQDGQPPGTVFIAVWSDGDVRSQEFHFDGDPVEVIEQSVDEALQMLLDALTEAASG
jgi:nicotinamide-nucleotide amidase